MIQRLLAILFMQWLLAGIAFAATSTTSSGADTASARTPEARFIQGLDCLKQSDLGCAQLAAAGIPAQSPYAKVLAGNIAAAQGDFDSAFRFLLPLQVNSELSPEAIASLHTSLAIAYAAQPDELHALQHRVLAAVNLSDPADLQANQQATWKLLSDLSHDQLIGMRGESQNTIEQGWIDLALAVQRQMRPAESIAEWKKIYTDHPAASLFADALASQLGDGPTSVPAAGTLAGPIALILPLSVESFYPASDAIERGFMAAQAAAGGNSEIKLYATRADENEITTIYQHALSEGAKYVVGPVTEAEVGYLAGSDIGVPTLALNQSGSMEKPANLFTFGLSVHDEARQLATMAQALGMQNAVVIATSNGLSSLMAEAFRHAWTAETGQVAQQVDIVDITDIAALAELKTSLSAQPADFIVIAANVEEARNIRPYLDIAIPTFGFSHIYSGLAYDPANAALSGIRFVDTPWVLKPGNSAFKDYANASRDLPPGDMQRWFALGADAYRLLSVLMKKSLEPATINGLTGRIHISPAGEITRELAVARFGASGVTVEHLP